MHFRGKALRLMIMGVGCLWAHCGFGQTVLPESASFPDEEEVAPKVRSTGEPVHKAFVSSVKVPDENSIFGQELLLNGSRGNMGFSGSKNSLLVSRLIVTGAQISHPDDICQVEVTNQEPLKTESLGKLNGTMRYKVDFDACPFSFDVLDGAVLVSSLPACELKAADCKINPQGLWGPRMSTMPVTKAKDYEHERTQAEKIMQDNFRALMANVHDKARTSTLVEDQAGFSARRAEICRTYMKEDVFGFCALRVTEARALALQTDASGLPVPKHRMMDAEKSKGANKNLPQSLAQPGVDGGAPF